VELYAFIAARNTQIPELQLPKATFELTAPLLGLLLVFRTNSSYTRYAAGGKAFRRIGGYLRTLLRQLLVFTSDDSPREFREVSYLYGLVVDYYTWLCLGYLSADSSSDASASATPSSAEDAAESSKAQSAAALNRRIGRPPEAPLTPELVHLALAVEINRLPRLKTPQQTVMDVCLANVSTELTNCEQLVRTPIPLAYTRSLLRFLWLWLTLLPFSLVRTFTDFGKGTWWEGKPLVVVPVVTCFIGLLFLSIEDIAVQIEEPFVVQSGQLRNEARWFAADAEALASLAARLPGESASPGSFDPIGQGREEMAAA